MPKLPGSKLSVLQLIWVNNLFAVRKTFSCTSNCFWMNYWVKKKGHFQPQGISETPVYTSLSRSPLLQHRTTKREKKTLLQTPWYAINQPVRLTAVLSTDLRGHPVFALTRSLSADNTAPCRNKTQLQVTAERCETNTKTPQINTSVSLCALRVKELLLQKTPSPRITVSTLVFSLSPPPQVLLCLACSWPRTGWSRLFVQLLSGVTKAEWSYGPVNTAHHSQPVEAPSYF